MFLTEMKMVWRLPGKGTSPKETHIKSTAQLLNHRLIAKPEHYMHLCWNSVWCRPGLCVFILIPSSVSGIYSEYQMKIHRCMRSLHLNGSQRKIPENQNQKHLLPQQNTRLFCWVRVSRGGFPGAKHETWYKHRRRWALGLAWLKTGQLLSVQNATPHPAPNHRSQRHQERPPKNTCFSWTQQV